MTILKKITINVFICVLLITSNLIFAESIAAKDDKKATLVAIIIDDFGNKLRGTKEMMNLPVPITVAVMPFLATSKKDAQLAEKLGHDVIIHLPMEPISGKKSWLGPKPITTNLSDDDIKNRLDAAYKQIPQAVGINNHMGSKVISDKRVMKIVLQFCKDNDLFFIDSATSPDSVAKQIAKKLDVVCLKNDIFLDSIHSSHHVNQQIDSLLELATKQADVITIGHVGIGGIITANALTSIKKRQEVTNNTVKFVKITELIKKR